MIRYHLDEHIPAAIHSALAQHGIDATSTVEAELTGRTDPEHIAFALRERRVIVTHDDDFLIHHANGVEHAGIAYCRQDKHKLGDLLRLLVLLHACYSEDEMHGKLEYL